MVKKLALQVGDRGIEPYFRIRFFRFFYGDFWIILLYFMDSKPLWSLALGFPRFIIPLNSFLWIF